MAAYFSALSATSGTQLYKLGSDESVTKWTDPGFSLDPQDLTFFNNAVWFRGETSAAQFPPTFQLYSWETMAA